MSDSYGGADPMSGWVYIGLGALASLVGFMLLLGAGSNTESALAVVAVIILGAASLIMTMGVIAVGVTIGVRRGRVD
jgi:hypothetical protein